MWLRRIEDTRSIYDDSGEEFRYELETFYSAPLMFENCGHFEQTQIFVLYKYYKNNNGEFELCKSNEKVYVTIETLLSNFVVIDSKVDVVLKDLTSFKKDFYAKNLEESIAPFIMDKTDPRIPKEVSNLD